MLLASKSVQYGFNIHIVTAGYTQRFIPLETLASNTRSHLELLTSRVENKYRHIDDTVSKTEAVLQNWDKETEEGIRTIHTSRDEQVSI